MEEVYSHDSDPHKPSNSEFSLNQTKKFDSLKKRWSVSGEHDYFTIEESINWFIKRILIRHPLLGKITRDLNDLFTSLIT